MSNVALKLSEFQKYNAENILDCEAVMEKVVEVYNLMHGEGGEAFSNVKDRTFRRLSQKASALKSARHFQSIPASSTCLCIICQ